MEEWMDKRALDDREKINKRLKSWVGGMADTGRDGWVDSRQGRDDWAGRHLADGFNRQEEAHQYITSSSSSSLEQRMASPVDTQPSTSQGHQAAAELFPPCPRTGGLWGYHRSAGRPAGPNVCSL